MSILDAVERSLRDFHPKTHREFVLFNIARKFNDAPSLARYLNAGAGFPKKVLLEAARLAQMRAAERGDVPSDVFFRLLDQWRKERP
jgi:hypothetical protein